MQRNVFVVMTLVASLSLARAVVAAETGFTTTWSKRGSVAGFENPAGPLVNPGEGGNPGGFLKATHAGWTNPMWLNYYVHVFRAKGTTATLTISDWTDAKAPGAPVGQEVAYTFLKVQPYWMEDAKE